MLPSPRNKIVSRTSGSASKVITSLKCSLLTTTAAKVEHAPAIVQSCLNPFLHCRRSKALKCLIQQCLRLTGRRSKKLRVQRRQCLTQQQNRTLPWLTQFYTEEKRGKRIKSIKLFPIKRDRRIDRIESPLFFSSSILLKTHKFRTLNKRVE